MKTDMAAIIGSLLLAGLFHTNITQHLKMVVTYKKYTDEIKVNLDS